MAVTAALAASGPASARDATPDPMAIIQAAKAASGGQAWERLTGSFEQGAHGATTYTTWLDHRCYCMKSESVRDGRHTTIGFNGRVQWRLAPDGRLSIRNDPETVREAVTTAYVSINGYFFPRRFPARFRYLQAASEGGRAFDVVEASPEGGRAFQLWFDRGSHLLARVVDDQGSPPVSVELSDHRRIGRVLVAFRGVVRTQAGAVIDEGRVGSVVYRSVPARTFDPPAGGPP
jgi:hypothetical protein